VAVAFENSWYPGEIVKIITEDKAEINFMCHTATRSKTFIWPKKEDKQLVDSKFVLMSISKSDIEPVSNGRASTIRSFYQVDGLFNQYADQYFRK